MLSFFNKLLGAGTAVSLYSLKSLLINLGLITAALLSLSVGWLVFTILGIFFLSHILAPARIPSPPTFIFLGLLSFTLSLIIAPAMVLSFIVIIVFTGTVDLIKSIIRGAKDGYQDNWFHLVFNRVLFSILNFNLFLTLCVAGFILVDAALDPNTGLDEEALGNIYEEPNLFDLEDVPKSPEEVPNLQENTSAPQIELLSVEELKAAEKIAKQLGDYYTGYISLNERLTQLDNALAQRGAEDTELDEKIITDQFVSYSAITTPVIFVKQYQFKENEWKAVPASSFITDKESALHWLGGSSKHPILNDKVNQPIRYQPSDETSYPTRYKMHPYHGKEKTQELVESCLYIRTKLNELNTANVHTNEKATLNQSAFFAHETQRNSNDSGVQQFTP